MRKLFFCFLCMISGLTYSQSHTLSGQIVDAKTKKAIEGASVYLNGTSVHTTTNTSGYFSLSVGDRINTDLIISHVAYHIVSIPNPFEKIPGVIYLTEKVNLLDEVVIVSDGLERKQKLKMFREHFLGKTKSAKSCAILNEDRIQLYFNSETRRLTAFSESPIIIENKYLGYIVYFNLADFYVQYMPGSGFKDVDESFILGSIFFEDVKPGDKSIRRYRRKVYQQTRAFFQKGLAENTLIKEGYRILTPKKDARNLYEYFSIKDTLSMKKINILPGTDINDFENKTDKQTYGAIDIIDPDNKRSKLIFYTDSFIVDKYGNLDLLDEFGNVDAFDKLSYSGDLGKRLIGDMLPLDYEP